ncbi:hypothetical protein NXT3_PB00414 (plasmid) [Sinorhizobium fredii]|uniref:Uncharacterized protein n=1 Tax=Rhizobium fredii TaxID=380 RepID=A0A2L0HC42_RHIFR|nr:hypothetical protein NXT3_PB00414 [Sinorhizobium fredii]
MQLALHWEKHFEKGVAPDAESDNPAVLGKLYQRQCVRGALAPLIRDCEQLLMGKSTPSCSSLL